MKPIRNSLKALIIKDGKLLAIKLRDAEGTWYVLPGGGQDVGETFYEALRRECREEINCEIEIGDLRFIREYIAKNHEFANFEPDVHQVEFMFECTLTEGSVAEVGHAPDSTQFDIEWLDLDKLDSYRLYPLALRPLIARAADGTVPIYQGDIN